MARALQSTERSLSRDQLASSSASWGAPFKLILFNAPPSARFSSNNERIIQAILQRSFRKSLFLLINALCAALLWGQIHGRMGPENKASEHRVSFRDRQPIKSFPASARPSRNRPIVIQSEKCERCHSIWKIEIEKPSRCYSHGIAVRLPGLISFR